LITETHVILGIVGALSSLNSACLMRTLIVSILWLELSCRLVMLSAPKLFQPERGLGSSFPVLLGAKIEAGAIWSETHATSFQLFWETGDIETLLISILIQPEPSKIPLAEIPVTCSTRHARCPTLVCSSLHKVAQKDCAFYSRPGTSQTGTV